MSNIKIDSGLSYTIPVDSVDLLYLSKYVRSPALERIPLWSKTQLDGETGYCQVQILTQNDEESYSEPAETYECHICNVHVPVTCSKEHNLSEQHNTIKNIYQKVLERLSKQIDTSVVVNNDGKIDKGAYYCVPCSKIIKKENKDKHESSEFHAKSNKDTIIISEFYKIIKEDRNHTGDIVLIEDSDSEPVNTKSCMENNNDAATNNKLNNNCLATDHDDSTNLPTVAKLAIPGPSYEDIKIQPPNDERAETFEEYLKAMIKKYKLKVNLPVMTSEGICLESPNGDMVTVSQEHFHSYKQVQGSVYCQLCKMWISHDTKPHDVTENHVRNIFKPISEKFARTIDTVSSHCVPCNFVLLTNSVQHTLDDNHKKIVKCTRFQKVGKTFCEDCNLFIDTHNFSVHVKSKKHLNVIMINNSITTTDYPNAFFCKVCNLNISKNDIKNHVVAKMHLTKKTNDATNLNKNGADLGSKNTDASKIYDKNNKNTDCPATGIKTNGTLYCKICKVKVPNGGMETHVDGKSHKQQIIQLKSEENKAQNSNGRFTSASNNDSLASTSTSSSSRLLELQEEETNNIDEKIDEYYEQLEFSNDAKTEVWCKLCFTYLAFVESVVIDHMESKTHVEIATKHKMKLYNKFLRYTNDAKTTICELCNVNIPNVDRNIIEHMKGRNHEVAETELLKFHVMTKESSDYICECCDVRTTNYQEHINSKSHTITFLQNYEIDKKEMRKYVYEDDINDLAARCHRERYRNLLRHNYIYKLNDTNYYCGMCQIKLGRISEIYHVLGERHALKLREIEEL